MVPEAGIEPATQVSTTELLRQNWRKMMESNHQPSLAGTAFKAACAPCAPSSVVGAAGIEPATSCSQSKRATAALRPDDGCWQTGDFWAPRGSLFQTSLPTQKPTGRAFRSASLPCPAGRSYCRRYVHRPMDAAYSGPAGFCVGPRYFPGVVMVQQIGAAVCPMQCALITHLRAGFHLPAAGLYFANIEPSRR